LFDRGFLTLIKPLILPKPKATILEQKLNLVEVEI